MNFSLFARMPTAKLAPNDLNATVREVFDLYAQGNNRIKFAFDQDDSLPVLDIDCEQMKRVVVNLLENSISAIDGPARSMPRTSYDPKARIVTLEIRDTGAGIKPQDRARLFEPYFSTKPGGTGLGLTIVSTIVADHNGYIPNKRQSGKRSGIRHRVAAFKASNCISNFTKVIEGHK